MSSFRRAPVTGGLSNSSHSNVLASLRATQIITSKPVLPAELISTILDYLPIPDLMRFAQTSRRMLEMAYDDTRWVQRLKSMGLWNEGEARRRAEELMRRKVETQRAREEEERKKLAADIGVNGSNGSVGGKGVTLFDAGLEEQRQQMGATALKVRQPSLDAGFDAMTLSPSGGVPSGSTNGQDWQTALGVLKRVRSVRGHARQEYAKVYTALAPFYFDLVQSSSHSDPAVFRVFRDPEQQAEMLAQLKVFARSDFTHGWQQREEKLESMIGVFENAVLREFEQGYQERDYDGSMRRYAHVLCTLNGGAAGIDAFIQNHPLMQERDKLGNPLDGLDGQFPGHFALGPSHEFFRKLAMTLNEQSEIIDRVFPATVDVLFPFLERVTEDIIGEYITPLFDEAHERNIEAYLNAVSGVYEQSIQFCISLRPTKGSKDTFAEDVSKLVSQCFEPHIDLYLQDELDFFRKTAETQVGAWEKELQEQEANTESFYMSNVSRQAAKRDFLTSFKKVVMAPVNALPSIPISSPFGAAAKQAAPDAVTVQPSVNGDTLQVPSRSSTPVPGGLTPQRAVSPRPAEAPTTELAAKAAIMNSRLEGIRSLFSLEVALNLVHAAKASLERVARFVKLGGQSGEEAKEQCGAIFVVLLQILGQRHIRVGFDKAVNHLSQYNPREISEHNKAGVEPLVTFFELVNVGDLIQQMVEVFFMQELVAMKLIDRDDFLDPAVKEKKRFEQMLDERVAAGLNKGIDVLMDEVEYVCATTQSPTDFNTAASGASGKDGMVDIGPTETAKQVVKIVEGHTSMLVGSTDKNMLDVFNQEVGVRLFTALCKHLKMQRISVDGAIKLISDMNLYHTYILTLKNKDVLPYFRALRELSQIYLIDPSHAKEIATIIADADRYHGIFRAEEVYEFATRRADWYSIRASVEKAMYGLNCCMM